MIHLKLLEIESELRAKEQVEAGFVDLPLECYWLIEYVEREIGIRLGSEVFSKWRGWLYYRRGSDSLIICRGRAFSTGVIFGKFRAGFDVDYGLDAATEYERGFDVTPPQDLDHLLLNFGNSANPMVYLWYGENLEPYRLIFEADATQGPHQELSDAIVEALRWTLLRPKDQSLHEFLDSQKR